MSSPILQELAARGREELRAGLPQCALDTFRAVLKLDPEHSEGRRGQFEALSAYFPLYPILFDLLPEEKRRRLTDLMVRLVQGAGWRELVRDLLATLAPHRSQRAVVVVWEPEGVEACDSSGGRERGPAGPLEEVAPGLATWRSAGRRRRLLQRELLCEPGGRCLGLLALFGPAEPAACRPSVAMAAVILQLALSRELHHRQLVEELGAGGPLLENAAEAILMADEQGRITFFNAAAERLCGYRAAEIVGHSLERLLTEPYTRLELSSGHTQLIRRQDGTVFPARVTLSEFYTRGQRRLTLFVRDATELLLLWEERSKLRSEMALQEAEHRREVEEEKARAIREERRHLSRELHDSVSQALFGIVLGTQAAINDIGESCPEALSALDYVRSLAESGLADMRALLLDLRPETLEAEGLMRSLERQIRALGRRYRIELALELGPEEPEVPLQLKHDAYRLVVEAVTNVARHASATHLRVRVVCQGGLEIEVEDDGRGFEPGEVGRGRLGLLSMRERALGCGGRFEVTSGRGEGTRLRAWLPHGDEFQGPFTATG